MKSPDNPKVSIKALRLPTLQHIARSDSRLSPRLGLRRIPDRPLAELSDEQMVGYLNNASRRIIAQQCVSASLSTLKEFMRLYRSKARQSLSEEEERHALNKLRSRKAKAHICWRHKALDDISMAVIAQCVAETCSARDFHLMEAFLEALIKRIAIDQELADWGHQGGDS